MKKYYSIFAVAFAALFVLSCQREIEPQGGELETNLVPMQVVSSVDAKSSLELDGDAPTGRVLWDYGDKISVFDGVGARQFTTTDITDPEGHAHVVTFEGAVDAGATAFAAIYPYSAGYTADSYDASTLKITTEIPSVQLVSGPGSYSRYANVCVAYAARNDEEHVPVEEPGYILAQMVFQNVGGLLKFTLSQDGVHKSVTIRTSDASPLTGGVVATADTGVALPMEEGSADFVTIAAADDGFLAAGDYYAVVLPFSDKTVSLEFSDNLLSKKRKSSAKISLGRAAIRDLGTIDSGVTYPDGQFLILANHGDNYYALKAEKETGKERLLSVEYTGSTTSYFGDADMIWTLSKSQGAYALSNSGKYLGYKGSSNESYWLEAGESWTETNYLLDVTAQTTAGLYYVTLHSNGARYLSRNTSGAFFAFYGNTNQYANIMFVPATVDNRAAVTLEFEAATAEFTNTAGSYDQFLGYNVVATAGEDVITSTIASALVWSKEDDDNVIDEWDNGALTLTGNTGTATVKVSFPGDETYLPAEEVSYTITVTDGSTPPTPTTGWFETALADLTSSDVFVIVGNDTYTISNAQSTSSSPSAATLASASLSLTGTAPNRSMSGTIPDGVKWTLTGNGTDGYTFYSNANSSYHLYNSTTASSKSNDAMRVGNPSSGTDRKLFVLDSGNHLVTKDDYDARYLACYTTNPDWRGYLNSSTSETTITFYKYVAAPDDREEAGMSWSAESATATYTTVNNASSLAFTAPTLTVGNATGITYESTDETIATISNTGVVSVNLTDNSVKEGSTTIKAVFEGDEDYKPQTVSYTLTVVDNRTAATTPTFDPAAGEVTANQVVTFNPANQGLTFHYTVDGTEPTVSSPTAASVTIDAAKTVKVLATKTGYKPSAVASAAYTIAGVVEAGTLSNPYTVAEAIAAYQANPSIGSKYVKGIVCQEGSTYCFISDDGTTTNKFELYGFSNSDVACSALKEGDAVIAHGTLDYYSNNSMYEINGTYVDVHISKPVLTPNGGNFVGNQSVAITSTNSSSIRYTTDGAAPTTSTGNVYSVALNLSASATVKAVGIDENEVVCTAVASATFTKLQTYAVTWSAPSNGSITVKNGETTISSGALVPETATINITVSPADGYALSTLVYNDGTEHDIKSAKSFTMPAHAVSITATFEVTGGSGPVDLAAPASISITDINLAEKKFSGSWNANADASSYDWVISTASTAGSIAAGNTKASGNTTSTNFTTDALDDSHKPASGTVYYLYVRAVGDGIAYATSDYGQGHAILYQHLFTAKPSTGNNITLSNISWTVAATNLNGYNSANYAGVQFGSSKANGSITLTSTNSWGGQSSTVYSGYSTVRKVNVWANLGGTSVTPSVTIGGTNATGSGSVVKNSSAGSDWTKTSKVVFTPGTNAQSQVVNTGIVVVSLSSVKAGYICAVEILSD